MKTFESDKIYDMRGNSFSANYIEILNGNPYYGGMPVKEINVSENKKSKHFYDIIVMKGFNAGTIALTEKDYLNLLVLCYPAKLTKGEAILIVDAIIKVYEGRKLNRYLTYDDYITELQKIQPQLAHIRKLNTLSQELKQTI